MVSKSALRVELRNPFLFLRFFSPCWQVLNLVRPHLTPDGKKQDGVEGRTVKKLESLIFIIALCRWTEQTRNSFAYPTLILPPLLCVFIAAIHIC